MSNFWVHNGALFYKLNPIALVNEQKSGLQLWNLHIPLAALGPLTKGQLISKAIYGVLDSPKKRTKKI